MTYICNFLGKIKGLGEVRHSRNSDSRRPHSIQPIEGDKSGGNGSWALSRFYSDMAHEKDNDKSNCKNVT